jgi:hypothetical protein
MKSHFDFFKISATIADLVNLECFPVVSEEELTNIMLVRDISREDILLILALAVRIWASKSK